MAKDLLLEIGMEEIPARFVRGAVNQLQDKLSSWLDESRISYGKVTAFATPRRISVVIDQVLEKQEDVSEEVKGPAKKIALDEQGNWSKAALGFARSQGIDPEQLFFKELGGVQYVYANKSSKGIPTLELLQQGLTEKISSMHFPKNMRWGNKDLKYVRPIRWLVALFGNEVIPLEIAGIDSGRVSRGHRFLGEEVAISSPESYQASLKEQYVIVEINERKQMILDQINALAQDKGWHIAVEEDLLEEVLFLVEYPTVLFGSFDETYLHIPQEVLITSMREHQRYFPVMGPSGQLLPYFVTVRNGNSVSIEQVARGNEKVLRARLQDAKFFYEEDQKMKISDAMKRLETVVFHEELGSVGDKVRRFTDIANQLSERLSLDHATAEHISRTAQICKFDLVSLMVYEFPELQGIMGEDYARKLGESDSVAKAINEHYQPRYSGDASPASIVGAIVSIADKLDTIFGCFSIGIIPTGSQDPYALRRQAAGIVQIMLDHKLDCTLLDLFDIAFNAHNRAGLPVGKRENLKQEFLDFFALRVKHLVTEQARYDIVDAVMAAGVADIGSTVKRTKVLNDFVHRPEAKAIVDSFNRVNNLAAKARSEQVEAGLLQEPQEKQLFDAWSGIHPEFESLRQAGEEQAALDILSKYTETITAFFDHVMVMAEDDLLRQNRLALLKLISSDLQSFADFQKIVW